MGEQPWAVWLGNLHDSLIGLFSSVKSSLVLWSCSRIPSTVLKEFLLEMLSIFSYFRLGSRSSWGAFARSEAEFEEIIDNLTELEVETKILQLSNQSYEATKVDFQQGSSFCYYIFISRYFTSLLKFSLFEDFQATKLVNIFPLIAIAHLCSMLSAHSAYCRISMSIRYAV